ncbi:OsmC family protein [Ferdinandcohnia sp. SAFN-114]|uniref:OsmC family protein n=1 Tax=Ferdinandcohnia sp. SAFN-114 TaxID=3387275 RepID=UPI003F7E5FD6
MFEYEVRDGSCRIQTEYQELHVSADPHKGVRPVELLVSSLVGCSSGIFTKVLEKKRIQVDSIRVRATVDRNPEEANRVTKINLHFIVTGKNISEKQIQKSLEVTRKNCSMIQSVKDSIQVTETFEIRGLANN